MVTITRVAKDARFFTNMSNARRALKKFLDVDTATANSFIHQEPMENGGRYWFSESAVNKAANDLVEADKAIVVEVTTQQAPVAPVKSKTRSETRNGVRRPVKGKCADVWNALDNMLPNNVPTIGNVRDLAKVNGWNINNATIEFYAWRKFNGLNNKGGN
ncbi:hypothetical protein 9g_00037 [Enterobacteria phage 9g]|uniref:Uncharacterized protein n=1 Tax=Enterobacteria phage 9g TaxID=1468411 RepID=X2KSS2_9CAUD|nr:hypothetical protein FH31_gp37 [Enterobacteria phage 9g]AHN84553.1 hypothetical protein 9g_00037 [Enterobacteria phage 9g]